jgi:DME family drug/metabolite transporter
VAYAHRGGRGRDGGGLPARVLRRDLAHRRRTRHARGYRQRAAFVGLFSWIVLRERPTPAWWTSTAICIAGLILLTLDGSAQPDVQVGGLVFSLAAGAGYAAYTVAARRLIQGGVHPSDAMAAAMGLGAILLLPVLIVAGAAWLASVDGLVVALWLGLVSTTAAYVLFGRGLRVLPAGPVATLLLAEPLVATLLGVGLLGETLGPAGWAGAALVAAGLGLQGMAASRTRTGEDPAVIEAVPV